MSSPLPAIIRSRRKEAGLTIEGLAFASGLSVATIQRVETGKGSPSLTTLDRLAGPLGTTSGELLGTAGASA